MAPTSCRQERREVLRGLVSVVVMVVSLAVVFFYCSENRKKCKRIHKFCLSNVWIYGETGLGWQVYLKIWYNTGKENEAFSSMKYASS